MNRALTTTGPCCADACEDAESAADDQFFAELNHDPARSYPAGYGGPKPLDEQIRFFAAEFGLSPDATLRWIDRNPLKDEFGAEGWFATPSIDALAAKYFSTVDHHKRRVRYGRAIEVLMDRLSRQRSFVDPRAEGRRFGKFLRDPDLMTDETVILPDHAEIAIFPAQFGASHRNTSVDSVLNSFKNFAFEIPLGIYRSLCMLFSHPERCMGWEQLQMQCSGDLIVSPDGNVYAVGFWSDEQGRLQCGMGDIDRSSHEYGIVSAFVPPH